MSISQLMKDMTDAGAPMEAVLIAVRAVEAKDVEITERDAVQAKKREKDAERKRLARASTDSPRTVTGRGADSPAQKEKAPLKEINQKPLKKEKPTSNEVVRGLAEEALGIWNGYAKQSEAKVVRKLGTERRTKLSKRLGEIGIDGWREAMGRAGKSALLGHDPPSWFDFDFLLKNETNILKLIEGKYDKPFSKIQSGPNTGNAGRRALARINGSSAGEPRTINPGIDQMPDSLLAIGNDGR